MSIFKSLARELEIYGEDITVISENGEQSIKGIIQPLLYKNKMYVGGTQTPAGFFDTGHFSLICPANITLPTTGNIMFQTKDKRYVLKRSEVVKIKGRELYLWAVLCPWHSVDKEDF